MGNFLSFPAMEKFSKSDANDRFVCAETGMQGWRIAFEDSYAMTLDLNEGSAKKDALFAIFDGHGGPSVAKFAGENLPKRLAAEEAYHKMEYELALKRAFLGLDEDLLKDHAKASSGTGCTAVAALITYDDKIYVANAGDSRCVISVNGKAKDLSYDHKPDGEIEKKRILDARGYVENRRVNDNLGLSRAFGDFQFKANKTLPPEKQIITADPDINHREITDEDEFLILACDGIWDCLSSQAVVDFVRYQVSKGKDVSEIGGLIIDHCLGPTSDDIGNDNMTIIIVAILHGRKKKKWGAWIANRMKKGSGYETPSTIRPLYPEYQMAAFRKQKEAMDKREAERKKEKT